MRTPSEPDQSIPIPDNREDLHAWYSPFTCLLDDTTTDPVEVDARVTQL